ncbi:GH12 family glycosyl hydrolase domain-containing protein [Nonomuraea jiangxiensis]|uniref:Fibronectin type III domain-containing protein n=1 Tax=Nonomuraea jiangxiensis TaxID=633440 RepID=A0A1G9SYZ1_9ACTN|nr:cellulose binding domain-containing protein [Nonomuraea jiangxiensis]SDM40669.1 Fibronectin type III domain-containing protein [Nonomuraea jiangxiensis]
MRHAHIYLIIGVLLATGLFAAPAQAAPVLCEKWGSTSIQSGRYVVMNNVWGADTAQCIDVNQSGGFTVTQSAHSKPTNGAPASYPAIYAGCHYATCTTGSNLPMQASASAFGSLRTSVSMTYPSSGTWDAAYDIWFDPTPRTDGQNTGAEIMIWLNRQGSIQPVGSQVGTVNLAGGSWQVWFGNIGWNVISYVRTSPTSSLDFTINTFYADAISRGYAQRSWYLTSVQAGFEPWVGGAGLAVNSFSFGTGGGGTDTTAPSTPGTPTASGTTSTSTTLRWGASTDTGGSGLAGYDILRTAGDVVQRVGSSTTTSFTDTGLSPATTYRYQVQARDGAGNLSPASAAVTVTTLSGGGNGGACTATATTQTAWNNGYVIQPVTVTNGSAARTSWTVTFPLPSGHTITGIWNASYTVSGGTVTVRNLAHNGNLGPNGTVSFGYQASRPNGNTQVPTGYTCA